MDRSCSRPAATDFTSTGSALEEEAPVACEFTEAPVGMAPLPAGSPPPPPQAARIAARPAVEMERAILRAAFVPAAGVLLKIMPALRWMRLHPRNAGLPLL